MTFKHIFILVIITAIAFQAMPAHAIRESKPILLDHRVRTIMYQPDEVYRFIGHYRFQSSIEFDNDEYILTISMGDSTAWMLNPSGNRLFLKPIDQDATTNMTLITNKRTYLFELHARETDDIDDMDMTFIMRFMYPNTGGFDRAGSGTGGVDNFNSVVTTYLDTVPIPELEDNPEKYNFRYTISGTNRIAPIRIFDDGRFTYFQFKDVNADLPAFFEVDPNGEEGLINYRTRGSYIVVERVSAQYTLRYGTEIVCVFNEDLRNPVLPDGPPV